MFSILTVIFEAGVLLGATYLITNRLWLPFGLNTAWNVVNDGIFGVGASGLSGTPAQGPLQAELTSRVWLSGGAGGVEASSIAVAVLIAVSIHLIWRAYNRGQISGPFWKRGSVQSPR